MERTSTVNTGHNVAWAFLELVITLDHVENRDRLVG
jgi:hypothetical protein